MSLTLRSNQYGKSQAWRGSALGMPRNPVGTIAVMPRRSLMPVRTFARSGCDCLFSRARKVNGSISVRPIALPAPPKAPSPAVVAPAAAIRVELHRGALAVNVLWPIAAAGDCAAWLRELFQ